MQISLLTDYSSSVEMVPSPKSPTTTEKQKLPTRAYRAGSTEKRALKEKKDKEVNKRDALIASKALYVLPILTVVGTIACIASAPLAFTQYKKTSETLLFGSMPLIASPLLATAARTVVAYQKYGGRVAWATARDAFLHMGRPEGLIVNTAIAMLAFNVSGTFFV